MVVIFVVLVTELMCMNIAEDLWLLEVITTYNSYLFTVLTVFLYFSL